MDDDVRQTCERMGELLQVCPAVHPEDFIFRFLYENPVFTSKLDAAAYYFNDGANSARQVSAVVRDVCQLKDTPLELLEFASGFGCLTRHLNAAMPLARTTACDIHPSAVEFIEGPLGGRAILSTADPRQFRSSQKYDVVFALSFFSHMPKRTFALWVDGLAACLKPGGHLIFTTHGLSSMRFIPRVEFDDEGFFFRAESEQKDLDVTDYGLSVTKPQFVVDTIGRNELSLTYFQQGLWWGHQDLYVVRT